MNDFNETVKREHHQIFVYDIDDNVEICFEEFADSMLVLGGCFSLVRFQVVKDFEDQGDGDVIVKGADGVGFAKISKAMLDKITLSTSKESDASHENAIGKKAWLQLKPEIEGLELQSPWGAREKFTTDLSLYGIDFAVSLKQASEGMNLQLQVSTSVENNARFQQSIQLVLKRIAEAISSTSGLAASRIESMDSGESMDAGGLDAS